MGNREEDVLGASGEMGGGIAYVIRIHGIEI